MDPMDVVLSQTAAPSANVAVAPVEFVWQLHGVSQLVDPRVYSSAFQAGPFEWNLMVLPPTRDKPFLGAFLAIEDSKSLPTGWKRCCEFEIAIRNTVSMETKSSKSRHRFTQNSDTWGWRTFIEETDLKDGLGWTVNDGLTLYAKVWTIPDEDYEDQTTWNSKKETGFVGILNQGATCYMNSLLHGLYHIAAFRRAVFMMPTDDVKDASANIPLALQQLFYRLQHSDTAASTAELTKSFGWSDQDGFTQHDVQELNRVLIDNLDSKMRGSPAEGLIDKMFQGKIANVIRCLHIDHEIRMPEVFYDLSLDVKGCKSVYESLDKYCASQILSGANQFDAKEFGLQDATMGAQFESFPPVLNLQLKRFQLDPYLGRMTKVNDFFEFPEVLELDRYLSQREVQSCSQRYLLHSVLVHSGHGHGGHYVAYIRAKAGKWFKFNDDRVSEATPQNAILENYGGDEMVSTYYYGSRTTYKTAKIYSAYMLVYIREADLDWVLRDVTDEEVPRHLHARFAEEKQAEARLRKERAEAHLSLTLQIIRDSDLQLYHGQGLVDSNCVEALQLRKTCTILDAVNAISEKLNIDVPRLRLWKWGVRPSGASRLISLLGPEDQMETLGHLYRNANCAAVYVEILDTPVQQKEHDENDEQAVKLFFKAFDVATATLSFLCCRYIALCSTCASVLELGRELTQMPPDVALDMFWEVSPKEVRRFKDSDMLRSVGDQALHDGDIIVFQCAPPANIKPRYLTVTDYLDFLVTRVMVSVRLLEDHTNVAKWLSLELTQKTAYDDVGTALAEQLSSAEKHIDPAYIRFTGHASYFSQPRTVSIRKTDAPTLKEMLCPFYGGDVSNILYYEVLDVPLSTLDTHNVLAVHWRETSQVKQTVKLVVPKNANAMDVCTLLTKHPSIELRGSRQIRLFEVWNKKIFKVMSASETLTILGASEWHAEEIPADELIVNKSQLLAKVSHFARISEHGVPVHHGVPFLVIVNRNETVQELKCRLREKLGVSLEEFSTWKIALIVALTPQYLHDTDRFASFGFDSIGLEHASADPIFVPRGSDSASLRIYN